MPIRLVIADPLPVSRAGLFSFFSGTDVHISGEAQTAKQTVSAVEQTWPDVLLLNTRFPDGTGFEAVETLRGGQFDRRVIFFTTDERQTSLARALAVGADSYLLQDISRADLLRVVRELAASEAKVSYRRSALGVDASERLDAFGANVGELRRVSASLRRREIDPLNPLTIRETQVLRHIAMGLSNKEIASSLQLSLDTIKEHVQNILRKLDASDRTQAAVWAVQNKLVS